MNAKPWRTVTDGLVTLTLLITLMSAGCGDKKKASGHVSLGDAKASANGHGLPFYGEPDLEFRKQKNGSSITDTVQYTIPKFSFTNQDNKEISHRDYEGKVFVADFFFTECPSICPILSSQMARLQIMVKKEGMDHDVMFLSHSVKPENDTPGVLKEYGDHLGADYTNWNFVTGRTEDIYEQAEDGYMLTAFPSDTAQGGIFHTDKLSLIDRGMHIRGYYDGTSTASVDQLFEDLKTLVNEQPADTRRQDQ